MGDTHCRAPVRRLGKLMRALRITAVRGHELLTTSGGLVAPAALVSSFMSPVLLVGGWLLADSRQPARYSPLRQTVSQLAGYAGTDRWIMTSTLLVIGGCYFVTAAGLTGVGFVARALLVVAGLSAIGIAFCPEPVHGSTPQHLAWTSLGGLAIAIWPACISRRDSRYPVLLTPRGVRVASAVSLSLFIWVIVETHVANALGLAERLTSSLQTAWPFFIALALRQVEVAETDRTDQPHGVTGSGWADRSQGARQSDAQSWAPPAR
jgi:hypothetical protein